MIRHRTPLACLSLVLSLLGVARSSTAQAGGTVTVAHTTLGTVDAQTRRLKQRRDLWVNVADANPLVYDYAVTGNRLIDDQATAAEFRRLLGSGAGTQQAADAARTLAMRDTPVDAYLAFVGNVLALGRTIFHAVRATDAPAPGAGTQALLDQARTTVEAKVHELALDDATQSEAVARAALDVRWNALSAAERTQYAAFQTAVLDAIPVVVRWRRDVQTARAGRRLKYDYPGDGDFMVELTVTNRLGDQHRPNRWVGDGADVAEARPEFRPFAVSLGIGGVFGTRIEHTLEKISKASTPDTFRVLQDKLARFSFLPATFLNFQHRPADATNLTLGGSLGLGIRGEGADRIDQATDLVVAGTIGYEWLRVSPGIAYTSEVTSLAGVGDDGLTTDPNALAHANRDRKVRFVLAVHVSR